MEIKDLLKKEANDNGFKSLNKDGSYWWNGGKIKRKK